MHFKRLGSIAASAALWAALVTGSAFAACTERVDHSSAGCLSASWKGTGYTLTNDCAGYDGEVKALVVPIRSLATSAGHVVGASGVSGLLGAPVQSVQCCGGEGICQPEEGTTNAGCLAQWEKSAASDKCWDETVTAVSDSTNCKIETTCRNNLDAHGNDQVMTRAFLKVRDITIDNRGYLH